MPMLRWIENKYRNTSLTHLIGAFHPRVRSRSRFRLRFAPLTLNRAFIITDTRLCCLLSRSDFGLSWARWSFNLRCNLHSSRGSLPQNTVRYLFNRDQ
jgi:hypothetical protein